MPRANKVPEPTLKISARIEERVCYEVAKYTSDRAGRPSQAQAINESLQWWVAAQASNSEAFKHLAAIVASGETQLVKEAEERLASVRRKIGRTNPDIQSVPVRMDVGNKVKRGA